MDVKVDGEMVEITGLKEPLKLRAGEHELTVTSGEFKTVTKSFTVYRGDNPVLIVTLEPKAPKHEAKPETPPGSPQVPVKEPSPPPVTPPPATPQQPPAVVPPVTPQCRMP